jgi:hypothetical protein
MSCRNLLNHGDILLQKSQKEFNNCDLWGGEFKFYREVKKTNNVSREFRSDELTD